MEKLHSEYDFELSNIIYKTNIIIKILYIYFLMYEDIVNIEIEDNFNENCTWELLAGRGYQTYWFCNTLSSKGIAPCILGKHNQKSQMSHGRDLYKERYKIEIIFSRRKILRRIANPYVLCAHTFTCGSALILYLISPDYSHDHIFIILLLNIIFLYIFLKYQHPFHKILMEDYHL